jgi:hypothetical protein
VSTAAIKVLVIDFEIFLIFQPLFLTTANIYGLLKVEQARQKFFIGK